MQCVVPAVKKHTTYKSHSYFKYFQLEYSLQNIITKFVFKRHSIVRVLLKRRRNYFCFIAKCSSPFIPQRKTLPTAIQIKSSLHSCMKISISTSQLLLTSKEADSSAVIKLKDGQLSAGVIAN